jgi:hypothetical protein
VCVIPPPSLHDWYKYRVPPLPCVDAAAIVCVLASVHWNVRGDV